MNQNMNRVFQQKKKKEYEQSKNISQRNMHMKSLWLTFFSFKKKAREYSLCTIKSESMMLNKTNL